MKKSKIAICYDFDGTLTPENMQEYDFIPNQLKTTSKKFWKEVKDNAKTNDMDEILSYLKLILDKTDGTEVQIYEKSLQNYGKEICFFDGVDTWFERINKYGKDKNITIEHYIISSGLKPMIEGSKIKKNFKHIFACDFKYDQHGVPKFPSAVINYTTKTQYLFRINKHGLHKENEDNNVSSFDLLNNWNNDVNEHVPDEERPIPFSQMIYIGDGLTDVPAMKMINYQGGYSIAVYNKKKRTSKLKKSPKAICKELLKNKRCSFIAPADYQEEKELDTLVKTIVDKIHCEIKLRKHYRIP